MMKKQYVVLGSAVLLFLVLYFGFDIIPQSQKALEKSRALAVESTNIDVLLADARKDLSQQQQDAIMVLERAVESAPDDPQRIEALKALSGRWFAFGFPALAGAYAEMISELSGTEESWSITGTTFNLCLQRTQDEQIRNYCFTKAVNAFENAISLNPSNTAHQVNLALTYVENPQQDNPMRGISMLLELNEKDPDDVLVLNTLARLAIRTGQYQRAQARLERARSIDPSNSTTACLLATTYEGLGDAEKSRQFADECQRLQEKYEDN